MGFLDKAKKQLGGAVDKHGDKIATGIDKAAEVANKKTGGKHGSKIAKASSQAKNALDKLDGKNDDLGGGRGPQGPRGPRR